MTVSCAEGDTGFIFEGELGFDVRKNSVDAMPDLPFKIMMNVGNPDRAFDFAQLPNEGVGLARLEFIINRMIGVHPKALLNFAGLPADIKESVEKRIAGYPDPVGFYVEKLVEGISTLAAAFWPKKVIVRLSDFKSNEYANLIGGKLYEPEEENPMLGFRGASRYISESFRDCFELECRALKKVRNEMGLTNVEIMVPFVRTLGEASQVVELLAGNGLKRGENGLKVIMMCELPSNALLADEFLEFFGWLLHRFQRPDPADPGPGSRFRHRCPPVRRAQSGGEEAAGQRHRCLQQGRQVHRHLRPGSVGPPGPGPLADGAGHRERLVEPRLGAGYLVLPRRGARPGLIGPRCIRKGG